MTAPGIIEPGRLAAAADAAGGRRPTPADQEARRVAESFEAMFLAQMLENMTSGIEVDSTFGGGPGERLTRSMLNDEYAKAISRTGGIGVADAIYREILRLQEVEQ